MVSLLAPEILPLDHEMSYGGTPPLISIVVI